MERWSGCVALVTGGSAGIGAAIVRRLANHGLKVVACARQVEKIQVIELNNTEKQFCTYYQQNRLPFSSLFFSFLLLFCFFLLQNDLFCVECDVKP